MSTFIVRSFLVAVIYGAGLSIGTDFNVVRELAGITLISFALVYAVPRLFSSAKFFDESFMLRLALTGFALVSTTQSISNIVDTEIPRFKILLKLIYYVYLAFILSPMSARVSTVRLAILSLLTFTSYPFHWMYIVGTAKSLPLFLMGLYVLTTIPVRFKEIVRDRWLLWAAAAAIFWTISNAAHANYFQGFEGLMRLLAGVSLFIAVRESKDHRWILVLMAALAAFHAIFFLSGLTTQALLKGELADLWSKKRAMAGINTNDIAGYFVIIVPAILGSVLHGESKLVRRGAVVVFGSVALLLGLSQARAAWPVFAATTLVSSYLLSVDRRMWRKTTLKLAGLTLGAAILIGLGIVLTGTVDTLTSMHSLKERFELISLAMGAVARNPLTGIGYGNSAALAALPVEAMPFGLPTAVAVLFQNGAGVHCHNLALQLWLDGGVGYAVATVGLMITGVLAALQGLINKRVTTGQMVGALGLAGIALQGVVNYHFIDYPIWISFWLYLALCAGPLTLRQPTAEETNAEGALPTSPPRGLLPVVAGLVLVAAIHAWSAYFYARSMDTLRGLRFISAQNATIIVPRTEPSDAGRILLAAHFMTKATLIYKGDQFLVPIDAELEYQRSLVSAAHDTTAARRAFEQCAVADLNPSFCLLRLSRLIEEEDPKRAEALRAEAARRDPFGLRADAALRPY